MAIATRLGRIWPDALRMTAGAIAACGLPAALGLPHGYRAVLTALTDPRSADGCRLRGRRGRYIGGTTPFFSTVTTRASTVPSAPFGPITKTALPGWRSLRSALAKVTIGVPGGIVTVELLP